MILYLNCVALFHICTACIDRAASGDFESKDNMSSMPYAMQLAKKEKQRQRKQQEEFAPSQQLTACATSDNPTMYSSKMMNSIWGMYNKYAVHNLKSNQGGQQPMVDNYDSSVVESHQMNAGGEHPDGAEGGARAPQISGGHSDNGSGYLSNLADQFRGHWTPTFNHQNDNYDTSVVDAYQMDARGEYPVGPQGSQGRQISGGYPGSSPGYLTSLADQFTGHWTPKL